MKPPATADDSGALFRPIHNTRTDGQSKAITVDGVYKIVRGYSAAMGFEIGARSLRAAATTNALDHQADIAKLQDWLGSSNGCAESGHPSAASSRPVSVTLTHCVAISNQRPRP